MLVYRTFMSATVVFERLLEWFAEGGAQRDRVARLVLLWVNNHFNDFETDASMTELMDKFELALQTEVQTFYFFDKNLKIELFSAWAACRPCSTSRAA